MIKKCVKDVKEHRWFYVVLVGIVCIAAFVRLWGLGNVPFVADEFLDVNATYGYFKTGEWQAWDFNHGEPSVRINQASDERAWLYRIQVAWLYDFLTPTESVIRLVSALWGIVTTIILYAVTLSFTKNRWIALIAAFLWAVSVPAIEINRKIRMYSMFAPIFLLFMWSLFQFIESHVERMDVQIREGTWNIMRVFFAVRWIYIVPVVLLGALAMHLHVLAGNFIVVVFFYFVVMIYFGGGGVMRKRYMAYVGVIAAALLLVKYLRPEQWMYFMQTLTVTDHINYIGHILRNYWHPLLGGALMITGAWFLIGVQKQVRAGLWVTCSFFVIMVMAMFFWSRNVGPQYIFFAQPFGLMLAASGVVFFAEYLQKITQKRVLFFVVIMIGCIFVPNYGYFFEENNTYHITAESDTVDYRKVFDYVKRNYADGEVLITRNFRNYYWSELGAPVFDFGSERSEDQLAQEGKVKKITQAYVDDIVRDNPKGWVVIAGNDETFVEKEAQDYFDTHFERVKGSSLLNGDVRVYRWGVE